MPKIVVLDGYTVNPGDLSWSALEELGECRIFDRTSPELTFERCRARRFDRRIGFGGRVELGQAGRRRSGRAFNRAAVTGQSASKSGELSS